MTKKTVVNNAPNTLEHFRLQVSGLSRDRLIALKNQLTEERHRVKDELRTISSTNGLRGQAREYAKTACIRERDFLGDKIAHVIQLLSRMKRLKKALQRTRRPTDAARDPD